MFAKKWWQGWRNCCFECFFSTSTLDSDFRQWYQLNRNLMVSNNIYNSFSVGLTMHIPTRFIKRHVHQSQFSGSCKETPWIGHFFSTSILVGYSCQWYHVNGNLMVSELYKKICRPNPAHTNTVYKQACVQIQLFGFGGLGG